MPTRPVAGLALELRLPRLIGWTCFTVALLTFVSDRHRSFFGRWSSEAFGTILCAGLVWCVAAWTSRRAYQAASTHPEARPTPAALVDGAILFWGAGYLWATLDTRSNASQVFDLNLFGSSTPEAIVLYWASLALLVAAGSWVLLRRVCARWANARVLCVTLATLAVLGEGIARAKAVVVPATQGFPTYASALWIRRHVQLNRQGFRDIEHPLARIPGTHRILLIGDSFAFGIGVAHTGDRLGEQLAMHLGKATGAPWEVINASHPDRNTLEETAVLDSTIAYHPDLVILVYVFNDIDYLYPVTERTVLTEEPETAWQRVHPVRVLFRNSFLFQELYVRVRALRWSLREGKPRYDPYADARLVRKHLVDLGRFVAKAESAGASVGVVPFDPTVVSGGATRRRDEVFEGQALAAGLPIWPVDSAFDGFTLPQLRVNRLDGHPNELANRLVAIQVAPRVIAAVAPAQHHQRHVGSIQKVVVGG